MTESIELLERTFEAMDRGEMLPIIGGYFPGRDDRTDIIVSLEDIFNIRYIVTGEGTEPRPNLIIQDRESASVEVGIERGDKRFGFDPSSDDIRYGKRVAVIGNRVVDLLVSHKESGKYYFVGPAAE